MHLESRSYKVLPELISIDKLKSSHWLNNIRNNIFLAASVFEGIVAADEQVASATAVGGIIFFHITFSPLFPPAISAYTEYITT